VKPFAFLFPGQGSQYSGMGFALVDAYPCCRALFETADNALGFSISEMCFSGSDDLLALTENTQPAILATSIAALRVLEERGLRPVATAGHSLGEYTAQVCAGSLEFSAALQAVRKRGQFMQAAVGVGEGAMAAIIGLESDVIQNICDEASQAEVVSLANLNGRTQSVIAGHRPAVQRAIPACKEAGASHALLLNVSAPFHCSLMEPVAKEMTPVLESLDFKDPAFPIYSNVDAAPVQTGSAARDALLRQIDSPVRWLELTEAMIDDGIETFVEIGPGNVLRGLVRRVRKGLKVLSAGDPEKLEKVVAELSDPG
jgi:[acyl-carrier-protein] S-malonyltransferase